MQHINIGKVHPDSYKQLLGLSTQAEAALAEAGLSPLLAELVKIRVSQINGCAFCLRAHSRDAVAKGESADRLAVLAAWWESQYFSPVEEAALQIAEDTTQLTAATKRRERAEILTPAQVSAVTWLAIVMTAWNRVAIQSHYSVSA
jgi:AhpD family alkylhydroperoxidase